MKRPIVPPKYLTLWLCAAHAVALALVLAGCNVGPAYVAPTMTAPAAFKEAPAQGEDGVAWTVAQPQDAALRG